MTGASLISFVRALYFMFVTGLIREKQWYGPEGIENARTKKEPIQSIPTFAETVELLMKVGLFLNFLICSDNVL